ncbi:Fc.00g019130.m01.CDS01 [Cosmosporella sp. VM-42]
MTEPSGTDPSKPSQPRRSRRGKKQRPRDPSHIEIEKANQKSNKDFVNEYIKPSEQSWPRWKHPRTEVSYTLDLKRPSDMSDVELDACFNLVDETSGEAYRNSSVGWHVRPKKEEMRSTDLRYIQVKDAEGITKGFTSMMPTIENSEPVVYCFEIHLKPELQG